MRPSMPLLHSTLGLLLASGDSRSASELTQSGNLSQALSPQAAHSCWRGSDAATEGGGDTGAQIRWISSLGLGNCTRLLLAPCTVMPCDPDGNPDGDRGGGGGERASARRTAALAEGGDMEAPVDILAAAPSDSDSLSFLVSQPPSLLVSPTGASWRHQTVQNLGHAARCRTSSVCTRSFISQ